MKITTAKLRRMDACEPGIEAFNNAYPSGFRLAKTFRGLKQQAKRLAENHVQQDYVFWLITTPFHGNISSNIFGMDHNQIREWGRRTAVDYDAFVEHYEYSHVERHKTCVFQYLLKLRVILNNND